MSSLPSVRAVESEDARGARIIDFLFRDTPGSENPPPQATFRIVHSANEDRLALMQDGKLTIESESDAALAELLLGQMTFQFADQCGDGMIFHAAALGCNGRAILIPGGISRGKTTLTAQLVHKGLDYLTDELVYVPNGSDEISALTRPLSLKERTITRNLLRFDGHTHEILSNESGDLIPASLLGNVIPNARLVLGLFLFPHYQPETQIEFIQLTPAQTAFALMECLINARNLPDHGLSEAARLARLAPAYRLHYSQFEQIEEHIDRLVDSL